MNIFGIKLVKIDNDALLGASMIAALAGLFGSFLMYTIGGSMQNILGLYLAAFSSTLVSMSGADFKRAGHKGAVLCVAISIVVYCIVMLF